MTQLLEKALKQSIEGEVRFDSVSRRVYSVDASIYEVEPYGIVLPKHRQDLIETVRIAREHRIPIIPRGAATGITGGCLGKGIIVDTSKYLNRILEINLTEGYALCEPGVIQNQLNDALAPMHLRLGPETSTGNRATLGGMLANNAAGARSLRFGRMVDHILSVELLLSDGNLVTFEKLSPAEWEAKCLLNSQEGEIYRTVRRISDQYADEIRKRFPVLPRRVDGYNLDLLLQDRYCNLAQLIAGSEGTFGIATRIKVAIVPKQKETALCLIPFDSMQKGMRTVERILTFHPSAVEMIDDRILEAGRRSPALKQKLGWLKETPRMLFAVELDGEGAAEKAHAFAEKMKEELGGIDPVVLTQPETMQEVWEVRKSGLGLLLSKRAYSRAIAFVEDLSVAPGQLPEFVEKFESILKRHEKEAGMYGHVGSGCLHLRPYIDLRKPEELETLKEIMLEVADLVLEHHGALSGEHGDGLIRSWMIPKLFGKTIEKAFLELKSSFDPIHLMNPGKIVNAPPLEQNLRMDPSVKQREIPTFRDFSKEGGFSLAVDLCNGNSLCRKPETIMCPSFQATGEEFHTTRARATALRDVVNGKLPLEELTGEGIQEVMDLCLECKGCKTECPSQVDMAKIKSELLYQYQEKNGYSLRNRLFGNIGKINAFLSPFASLSNRLTQSFFGKKLQQWIGIAKERSLPPLAAARFSDWHKKNSVHTQSRKHVVLFSDTFTEFQFPEIGIAASQVLEKLGYDVIVPAWSCCGRPQISKGLLKEAKASVQKTLRTLLPYAEKNIPIIGLEPSCLFTLKDDLPDLLPEMESQAERLLAQLTTFDAFLEKHLVKGKLPFKIEETKRLILLHGHCHQKALAGMSSTLNVLRAIPGAEVEEIPSGCCGMAGSFGYEAEHYALSMQIGSLHLFPAVLDAPQDAFLVADGLSCRTQIEEGTHKKAMHLAVFLSELLSGSSV